MGGNPSKSHREKKSPRRAYSLHQRQDHMTKRLKSVMMRQDSCYEDRELDEITLKNLQSTRPWTLNAEELRAFTINPKDYRYPFENLVFEGGGVKGIAYVGAVKVLEDMNILPQIKRFSGTSIGAMVVASLAVGYNSADIKDLMYQDLLPLIRDAKFGYLSLIPNMYRHYGWNSGKRVYNWYGNVLSKKTNDPDITFSEVYKRYGVELCIVATNLNHMTEDYFHPKTTPDMPVRLAVRMSMSLPGLFKPVPYTINGEKDLYIDGGVLCSYPIHCFDGWWLSMKPGDSFLQRLQPLEDLPQLLSKSGRFGEFNEKTLGILLYADFEDELFREQLDARIGVSLPKLPNTPLANKRLARRQMRQSVQQEHRRVVKAVNKFLKVLKKHDVTSKGAVTKEELQAIFADDDFSQENADILFGENSDAETAYGVLDEEKNGNIEYHQLIHFVENTGVFLTQRYLDYQRRDITGLASYLETLHTSLLNITMKVYIEDRDLTRTVGINTGHVGTTDFKLETADKDYIVQQGERGMISFLKYYAATQLVGSKSMPHQSSKRDKTTTHIVNNKAMTKLTGEQDETTTHLVGDKATSQVTGDQDKTMSPAEQDKTKAHLADDKTASQLFGEQDKSTTHFVGDKATSQLNGEQDITTTHLVNDKATSQLNGEQDITTTPLVNDKTTPQIAEEQVKTVTEPTGE